MAALAGLACASPAKVTPAQRPAAFTADPAPDLGPVVARVAGNPIFASEVRAQSERSGQAPRQALEELIRFQLLAERARERGLAAQIPESEVPRSLLVQRLIEREFEPVSDIGHLPDADLRRLYDLNKTRYVHPRMVHVALLSVYPRRNLPKKDALARAKETAFLLFDYVSRRPVRTPEDFGTVAKEPTWTSRKVMYTQIWQGPDESSGPLRAEEGAAIARLRRPGDTTALMEDQGAYHIARYMDEEAPKNVTFDQAREELRREYYPRWRQDRWKQFTARLQDEHRVEAFADKVVQAPPATEAPPARSPPAAN
jgi:hypothetical protein